MIQSSVVEPLHDFAGSCLNGLLTTQPVSAGKIGFAWRVAAGAALARVTTIAWSTDGTLTVTAADAAWQREVRRARAMLLERLGHLLGPGVVTKIAVVECGPEPPRRPGRSRHA